MNDFPKPNRGTPAEEQLYRLLAAVEHYDRMGWLQVPDEHRWKYDGLLSDVRALVWPNPQQGATAYPPA